MHKILIIPLVLLLPVGLFSQSTSSTPTPAAAYSEQAPPDSRLATSAHNLSEPERGALSYIDFGGSSNDSGHIFTVGLSAGYQFNKFMLVNVRVPFYFVSAPTTSTTTSGEIQTTTYTDHGIGDPSFELQLSFPNRVLDYKTYVTTWVPVANINSGFTTGSVLVNWTNYFSQGIGRLRPFSQIDIGNTVPDTPLFLLPYTAQGFNARFEGGSGFRLTKIFNAGASFYYVLPSGQQDLYSREVHSPGQAGTGGTGGTGGAGGSGGNGGTGGGTGGSGGTGGTGGGTGGTGGTGGGGMARVGIRPYAGGSMDPGFMTQEVTVGNDLTRDHGFSTWLTATLPHFVDLQVGFTRSYGYDLNTISFGIGFDPIQAFRHPRE